MCNRNVLLQMLAKLKEIQRDLLEREIIAPPLISWKACGDNDENNEDRPRNFSLKVDDNEERELFKDKQEELLAVSRMSFLISAYEPMYWWFELFGAALMDSALYSSCVAN